MRNETENTQTIPEEIIISPCINHDFLSYYVGTYILIEGEIYLRKSLSLNEDIYLNQLVYWVFQLKYEMIKYTTQSSCRFAEPCQDYLLAPKTHHITPIFFFYLFSTSFER